MKGHLWTWAILLAATVALGQFIGLGGAWNIVRWVVIGLGAVMFAVLIIDGFLELRERRNGNPRN